MPMLTTESLNISFKASIDLNPTITLNDPRLKDIVKKLQNLGCKFEHDMIFYNKTSSHTHMTTTTGIKLER